MTPSIRMDTRLGRVGKFLGGFPIVGLLMHWLMKIFVNKLNPFKKLKSRIPKSNDCIVIVFALDAAEAKALASTCVQKKNNTTNFFFKL